MARILVAEDEDSDWLLLRMALKRTGLPLEPVRACDGAQAVEELAREARSLPVGERLTQPRFKMLLLDLKMPRMNGFEVLEWWHGQPELAGLPVMVLSSSSSLVDMEKAKGLGAREYVVKPAGLDELGSCVRGLAERYALREGGKV